MTPDRTAIPASSNCTTWLRSSARTSWPGRVRMRMAISFAITPVGTHKAASKPRRAATTSCRRATVGSSPYTSSPTSASAMARRMAGVGRVTVSERRSTRAGGGTSKATGRAPKVSTRGPPVDGDRQDDAPQAGEQREVVDDLEPSRDDERQAEGSVGQGDPGQGGRHGLREAAHGGGEAGGGSALVRRHQRHRERLPGGHVHLRKEVAAEKGH